MVVITPVDDVSAGALGAVVVVVLCVQVHGKEEESVLSFECLRMASGLCVDRHVLEHVVF